MSHFSHYPYYETSSYPSFSYMPHYSPSKHYMSPYQYEDHPYGRDYGPCCGEPGYSKYQLQRKTSQAQQFWHVTDFPYGRKEPYQREMENWRDPTPDCWEPEYSHLPSGRPLTRGVVGKSAVHQQELSIKNAASMQEELKQIRLDFTKITDMVKKLASDLLAMPKEKAADLPPNSEESQQNSDLPPTTPAQKLDAGTTPCSQHLNLTTVTQSGVHGSIQKSSQTDNVKQTFKKVLGLHLSVIKWECEHSMEILIYPSEYLDRSP